MDLGNSVPGQNARVLKVIGGTCLVLLSMVGLFVLTTLQSTSADQSTSLIGMPTSLRATRMMGTMKLPQGFRELTPADLRQIPGPSGWKELGIASLEAAQASCSANRDVSMKAHAGLKAAMANMDKKDMAVMFGFTKKVQKKAKVVATTGGSMDSPYGLPGVLAPFEGFWDPFSLSDGKSQGELFFFREAEIKHGRVCMLALLGAVVQEASWGHPLFGGDLDIPFIKSIGEERLLPFWPALFIVLGIPEVATLGRIDYNTPGLSIAPQLKDGEEPGAIGFDPLGLKPDDPEEYLKRQNQELLHGRLAMIATAGAIAQEVLTQAKLTEGGIYSPPDIPV